MLKYFKLAEFDSPDRPGSGKVMNLPFLLKLDRAREIAGIPFVVISGYRSPSHNKKVGGVADSAHISGYAADIRYKTIQEAIIIIEAAKQAGFKRIGINNGGIHLDTDPTKKTPAMWSYPKTPKALKRRYFPSEQKNTPFVVYELAVVAVGIGLGKLIHTIIKRNGTKKV